MPEVIVSAVLLQKDNRVLAAKRRPDRPPFGGHWLPPLTLVSERETAEEAVERHARVEFGVHVSDETFLDTVYVEDHATSTRYVTNIFRAQFSGGPPRLRQGGEYDDARWLSADDLERVWMPPTIRSPIVRSLTDPDAAPGTDWQAIEQEALGAGAAGLVARGALPLAERPEEAAPEAPPPDNAAGWETIAKAYQEERYGDRDAGRLKWSWGLFEDELQVLGDVRGARAIVLGCGGGQDVVALERMGAVPVGIDLSAAQIGYARKYAQRHGAENASFVQGSVDDLSRFDDDSFDLAVSIHALGYVQDVDRALGEAARVLKPAGVLAISVPHPFHAVLSDEPPFVAERSYWSEHIDWDWQFASGTASRFRDYCRTVADWLRLLREAGFELEDMREPRQAEIDDEVGPDFRAKAALAPYVLILKARKR
jgi:ubiquinone/menaquinone biosynthesis C-methylase UbiE/ADP-ribose pyrophosphatase YjhB (NUDIX family)